MDISIASQLPQATISILIMLWTTYGLRITEQDRSKLGRFARADAFNKNSPAQIREYLNSLGE